MADPGRHSFAHQTSERPKKGRSKINEAVKLKKKTHTKITREKKEKATVVFLLKEAYLYKTCFPYKDACQRLMILTFKFSGACSYCCDREEADQTDSSCTINNNKHRLVKSLFLSKFCPFVHFSLRPQHSADQAALEEISVHHL